MGLAGAVGWSCDVFVCSFVSGGGAGVLSIWC